MSVKLRIEDWNLGGNNLEAYYAELPKFRAMAVDPQVEPDRRRVWELAAHGMERVPERTRLSLGLLHFTQGGFFFFGPEGPEIVERPGADLLAVRAIAEVVDEMEPRWVEAVHEARRVADAPEVMAAWSEVPIEAVLAVVEGWSKTR